MQTRCFNCGRDELRDSCPDCHFDFLTTVPGHYTYKCIHCDEIQTFPVSDVDAATIICGLCTGELKLKDGKFEAPEQEKAAACPLCRQSLRPAAAYCVTRGCAYKVDQFAISKDRQSEVFKKTNVYALVREQLKHVIATVCVFDDKGHAVALPGCKVPVDPDFVLDVVLKIVQQIKMTTEDQRRGGINNRNKIHWRTIYLCFYSRGRSALDVIMAKKRNETANGNDGESRLLLNADQANVMELVKKIWRCYLNDHTKKLRDARAALDLEVRDVLKEKFADKVAFDAHLVVCKERYCFKTTPYAMGEAKKLADVDEREKYLLERYVIKLRGPAAGSKKRSAEAAPHVARGGVDGPVPPPAPVDQSANPPAAASGTTAANPTVISDEQVLAEVPTGIEHAIA